MAGVIDSGVWKKEDWGKMWTAGDIPWNQASHSPFFDKHGEEMFGGKQKRVFVPFCGKSKDMIWLYEHGHTVIGVEIIEKAVQDFFEENKLVADVGDVEGVSKVYKTKDGRIQLYVADLFDITADLVGQADIIWDAMSLTDVNSIDNEKYVALISTFMKQNSRWYALSMEYDPSVWPGPPQSLSDEQIRTLFGARFIIETVTEEKKSSDSLTKPTETNDSSISQIVESAIKRSAYFNQRRYCFTPRPDKK